MLDDGSQGLITGAERPSPCEFYIEAKLNRFKSEKENRPVYQDVEMIKIFQPGGDFVKRKIRPEDQSTYPNQYAQFKAKQEQVHEGTPVE